MDGRKFPDQDPVIEIQLDTTTDANDASIAEAKMFCEWLEMADHFRQFTVALESAEKRYNLPVNEAINFANLKIAMKDELGYKDQSSRKLVECSHKITKDFLIDLGKKIDLTEAEVTAVLPAMAMKLTASETKFTLSAYKGGLFSKPQDLNDALKDIGDKYTQRFGL